MLAGVSQGLGIVSGNGQIAFEFQLAPAPLVVRATDASGAPLANVPVAWAITSGSGNLAGPVATTDSSGLAMANFLATALPDGQSFGAQTITATSPAGTATFVVTTLVNRATMGGVTAMPVVQLPATSNSPPSVTAHVSVFGGPQDGAAIPNVSVRVLDAVCANAQGGTVLTDAQGNASCDLILSRAPGSYLMTVLAGEYSKTAQFTAAVNALQDCTYSLAPVNASYGQNGGSGNISIATSPNCAWTSSSSSSWLVITPASGLGSGSVSYALAPNTGLARSATIAVSGQSSNIAQDGTGVPVSYPAMTNGPFPAGVVGLGYLQTLTSTGGCANPVFSAGALPPGLVLRKIFPGTFAVAGVPNAAGAYTFPLTVTDGCGATGQTNFTIAVSAGLGTTAPIFVSPAAVSFSVQAGDASVVADQTIAVTSSGALSFTATAIPGMGGNWLAVGGAGPAPATLTLHLINYSALGPGTYASGIAITPLTGGPPLVVPVSLTVAAPAVLTVWPPVVDFAMSGAASQTIQVQGTPASYSVAVSGGNWLSVSKTAGSAPDTFDLIADASALAPGVYNGSVTVTPTVPPGPALTIPVAVRASSAAEVTPIPSSVAIVYHIGDPSPAAQNISLQSFTGAASYTAASTAPWLAVAPSSGSTPDTLSLTVNPAGLGPGAWYASVIVSNPAMSVPVTLFIPTPKPAIAGVQNAASYASGPVAPGEAIIIYGSHLGPFFLVPGTVTNGKQDKRAGPTRVLFDGVAAPVLYASQDVVAALVPFGVSGAKATNLQVEAAGLDSDPVAIPAATAAPGIFADASGSAIAINPDYSRNGPLNGAAAGGWVGVYLTGGGATTPASPDGLIATDDSRTLAQGVTALINGENAVVLYAGNALGSPAGISLVKVLLPADLPAGAATIVLTIRGVSTQTGVTVYIRP